jgi:DNA-binding transcriptional LysR family regulator
LREAVIRRLGAGTVSKSEYVPDERLVPLPIEGEPVVTHIQVCCLKERRRTQSVASFFDAINVARG